MQHPQVEYHKGQLAMTMKTVKRAFINRNKAIKVVTLNRETLPKRIKVSQLVVTMLSWRWMQKTMKMNHTILAIVLLGVETISMLTIEM